MEQYDGGRKTSEKAICQVGKYSLKPRGERVGGQLNPTWVEWLMGFPTGWTELKD
ncbi:hypothetical protein QO179_20065 [Bacillus stercoris]|nr:hypothetical protein [Bacillus stercoris]